MEKIGLCAVIFCHFFIMLFPETSVFGVVWLETARIHLHSRRYRSAVQAVKLALRENPAHLEAWYLAGVIFQQVECYSSALKAYNRALELHPSDYITWYNRGKILEMLGDRTGAISSYGAVIAASGAYQDAQRRRDRLIQLQVAQQLPR
jgi:tetratricopeptide (TPR) repeat protein